MAYMYVLPKLQRAYVIIIIKLIDPFLCLKLTVAVSDIHISTITVVYMNNYIVVGIFDSSMSVFDCFRKCTLQFQNHRYSCCAQPLTLYELGARTFISYHSKVFLELLFVVKFCVI